MRLVILTEKNLERVGKEIGLSKIDMQLNFGYDMMIRDYVVIEIETWRRKVEKRKVWTNLGPMRLNGKEGVLYTSAPSDYTGVILDGR